MDNNTSLVTNNDNIYKYMAALTIFDWFNQSITFKYY